MNRWEEFCRLNKVPPRYQKAQLRVNKFMSEERYEVGKKWSENPINSLLLSGNTGLGKTYLMYALAREMFKHLELGGIRWFKSKSLDDQIIENLKMYGSASYLIQQMQEIPFLFLDDFGIERPTERAERDYYEIIDERVAWERPTIISTNLSDSQIKGIYGARILSRLKEFLWIYFEGEDIRGLICTE